MEETTTMGPPPIKDVYATRVYGWRDGPDWKLHRGLGHAKAAIAYTGGWGRVRGGEIWKREKAGWTLLYKVSRETSVNELPWKGE